MTQYQKIVVQFCRFPDTWFFPYDFMGTNAPELFVGYKAPTRINELEHDYPDLFLRQPEGKYIKRKLNKEGFAEWFPKLTKDLQNAVAKELNYYPQRPVEEL